MPAIVDKEKCDGCGDCVESCPSAALEILAEKCEVKPDDCIECHACVDVCSINHALTMAD